MPQEHNGRQPVCLTAIRLYWDNPNIPVTAPTIGWICSSFKYLLLEFRDGVGAREMDLFFPHAFTDKSVRSTTWLTYLSHLQWLHQKNLSWHWHSLLATHFGGDSVGWSCDLSCFLAGYWTVLVSCKICDPGRLRKIARGKKDRCAHWLYAHVGTSVTLYKSIYFETQHLSFLTTSFTVAYKI